MNLIIDIGKTSAKIVVLGADNTIEFEAVQSSQSLSAGPYLHLDTNTTWQWILQSLADCGLGLQILKCVVVTHGATFALLRGSELASPVMDYEFAEFESINDAYNLARDPFAKSYSPGLAAGLNAGRQIYYIQENFPKVFKSVTSIVPYPQYWAARLCGVLACEVTSLGSHTDLWQPQQRHYSQLAVKRKWVELMPPIRSAWEVLGQVLPQVAAAAGLNPRCQVYCGIHDSNASYLRYLLAQESQICVVSTGTWVVCMAGGQSLKGLDASRDMLANVDVYGRSLACARFFGGREFAELVGSVDITNTVNSGVAGRVIAANRFALPTFYASQGPFPEHHGRVVEPPVKPDEKQALASLYCALVTDACLDNLGVTGDLVIEGRFVKDRVFLQALAHFRPQQIVSVSDDLTGTVRGAARLLNWPDSPPAPLTPFRGDDAGAEGAVYRKYRERWRSLLQG